MKKSEIEDIYPLSPMQEGLLFQSLFDSDSHAYVLQISYGLRGDLEPKSFEKSWNELCQRHAVFRTAFIHEDVARPLQVVLKNRKPEITYVDLSELAEQEQLNYIEEYKLRDKERSFDLQRDVLMRISLIKRSNDSHQLIWSFHHILIDGWCYSIIQREFTQTYLALIKGEKPALPPVVHYRNYIKWLEKNDNESSKEFWSGYLQGFCSQSVLPKFVVNNNPVGYALKEVVFETVQSAELRSLAASQGVTLNTLVHCLWGILLAKYNNADDVLFGAVVSGRPAEITGVENMVGLFINAVPVRIKLNLEHTFLQMLRTVQSAALESEPHHYLPLADIQSQSPIGRDLLDHLLVFENYPVDTKKNSAANTSGSLFTVEGLTAHDQTHYDFDVTINPGDLIRIKFSYNANVYSDDQVERIRDHFLTVISAVISKPDALVSEFDVLPFAEREMLVSGFNANKVAYSACTETVHELFEKQVKLNPHSIAAIHLNNRITYSALNEKANQIAVVLRRLGVTANDFVGIFDDRGIDFMVGMIGVLKAGGAYIPIDAAYPVGRISYMISNSRISTLISRSAKLTRTLLEADDNCLRHIICFDNMPVDSDLQGTDIRFFYSSDIAKEDVADVRTASCCSDLAYMLYTSGSTGSPKGAMIRHNGAINHIYAEFDELKFHRGSAFLQSAPASSDISVWQFLAPLLIGGRTVIVDYEAVCNPEELFRTIRDEKVTLMELPPVVLKELLDYAGSLKDDARILPDLEIAMVTGESVSVGLVNQWFNTYHGIPMVNAYGPTEASDDICQHIMHNALPADQESVLIGKPIANMNIHIVDNNLRLVPIGVQGEICVSGIGVGKGYWRNEEKSTVSFVNNPFSNGLYDKVIYCTGDFGRWLPDGVIEFHGRFDHQVKIRGFRIEIGEVESVMLQHPDIKDVVVCVSGEKLIAYVIMRDECLVDTGTFRAFIREKLPEYMTPVCFIKLDSLPLTPNGKVDRNALPDVDDAGLDNRLEYEAPRTEIEKKLCDIWRNVLRMEKVGVKDNFFELGGHSLKAMQIVSQIYKKLGVKINLQDFFSSATIAALGLLVEKSEKDEYEAISPSPKQRYYDLSHAQQRLWIQDQMKGKTAYNMPEAHLFEDDLDIDALEKTFATLVERHEVLRTGFVEVGGEPKQMIRDEIKFTIKEIDLRTFEDCDERAARLTEEDAYASFDLTTPPLLRASVIKLTGKRHLFLLTIHHIIGDGWSSNILYSEILTLYNAYRKGLSNPLKPLRIQYKDFAVWQNRRGFAVEEEYWLKKLSGAPDQLRLPYDFMQKDERSFAGSIESVVLETDVVERLQKLSVLKQTTISNVILAVYKLFLYQLTKQDDICVGVGLANRNHPDLENLVGFFVNILPIRTLLNPDMEFDELLDGVIKNTHEAFDHQDYPFDLLVKKLRPNRIANRQPIINVVYIFQNYADLKIDLGVKSGSQRDDGGDNGLKKAKPFKFSVETSRFDLTLVAFFDKEGVIRLILEYDTNQFTRDSIKKYVSVLERFVHKVANQISEEGKENETVRV